MRTKIYLLLLFITFSCNTKSNLLLKNDNEMQNDNVLMNFEVDKYLGTWYEIARFDHSFERNLVGVTATYTMKNDGKIEVLNSGYKYDFNGKFKTAKGKAKIPDKNIPYRLKVAFFLFFYAEYNILELDENYKWALVGSSSPDFLWILSRTPILDEKVYQSILSKASERGYPIENLIKVKQKED